MSHPWQVLDLGVAPYRDVWAKQIGLVEQRQTEQAPDTLLLVEHPHVFTLGRRREAAHNVLLPGEVEVIEIERGGDVTYHGPGQLVAYPVIHLRPGADGPHGGERDLHRFLRNLEDAVISTCVSFGIASAGREPGKTGVWCDDATGARRKLCSMGIACRKWVTFHGLALNVSTDLAYFGRINPCGFESRVMTSMAAELPDRAVTLADVAPVLVAELGRALGRTER